LYGNGNISREKTARRVDPVAVIIIIKHTRTYGKPGRDHRVISGFKDIKGFSGLAKDFDRQARRTLFPRQVALE
jgi:hypothetical protein